MNDTAVAPREFSYSKQDFERVRRLIYNRAGISLAPSKEDMVYGRLVRRLRQHGLSSFHQYLDLLERSDDAEWQAFTNALTTNLTAFFREPHHFDALRQLFSVVALTRARTTKNQGMHKLPLKSKTGK